MYCRYSWEEYLEIGGKSNGAEGSSWYLCTRPATSAATREDDEVRKGREPDNAAPGPPRAERGGPEGGQVAQQRLRTEAREVAARLVTKYSRSAGLKYQVQDKENVTFNVFRVSVPNLDKVMRDIS